MCSRLCTGRRAVGREHSPVELQCRSYGCWMTIFPASLTAACLSGSWWSTDRQRWRRRAVSVIIIIIIIKLRWALFVTYTIIQRITSSEMCSLHLSHSSEHTLGAVGSQHSSAWGAVGGSVPCSRVSPQSWTIPARAEIRTHNLGLQVWRSIH